MREGAPPQQEQPVFVHPSIDPAAAAYAASAAARAQKRRSGGLPKYTAPAGGEQVSIPLLNAPHEQGKTMAEQAGAGRASQEQVVSQAMQEHAQVQGSIVEPARATLPGGGSPQKVTAASLGITATDTLPEEAATDPNFQTGFGSMLAAAQPQLALKYGVIRQGQRLAPQQLQQSAGMGGTLRQETLKDLQDLQALANQQQPGLPQTNQEADQQVAGSSAAHSARAGGELKGENEEDKEVREAIEMMDSFDYDKVREVMSRDVLNNPDQKELIESRCKPLDIEELILRNKICQDVPVIPGKFVITFESMAGDDDLELKRLVMVESKSAEVTDRYLLDKFAFMALTCGLKAINANPVPTHLDEKGEFDEKKFWLKFAWVMKRPLHMLASIGVNHTWFEMRVRRLFVAEKVGNG
jgi:hypothetical protein